MEYRLKKWGQKGKVSMEYYGLRVIYKKGMYYCIWTTDKNGDKFLIHDERVKRLNYFPKKLCHINHDNHLNKDCYI